MNVLAVKPVVITGACRGIGAGIAERFAQEGANLVLASNDLERVTFTSEQLASEYSVNSLALGIDVTDEADIQRLYQSAHERFGSIDVSVQNAGIITIDHCESMPRADFDKVLQVNTTGVWLGCREAARYMVKQGNGRLINTSSGQGRQGFIYTPHYA
ncbi:SDR family NAD(P)-dependent oxidoreductase, partial [Pseudomonas syringae pv. actinidiae]|nr:SDR family NAD(P)-dependent oxidoreductase [Pseudomonas syringae pv. actinidiae]